MRRILLLCGVLALVGCKNGPLLFEEGRVEEVFFQASQSYDGIGYGGNDVHFVSGQTRETKGVIFSCQHGRFAVRNEDLWKRLKQGDKARIVYRDRGDGRFEFVAAEKLGTVQP